MLHERHPCRMHQRCHHHGHHGRLVRHRLDEVRQNQCHRHQERHHRSPDAERQSPDAVRQRQPDEDRPDEVRHRQVEDHQDGLRRPDPDDPCPGLPRMGCCLGEPSDAEFPCPGLERTGCYPDAECQKGPHRQALEQPERRGLGSRPQGSPLQLGLQARQVPELLVPQGRQPQELVLLEQQVPVRPQSGLVPKVLRQARQRPELQEQQVPERLP